MSFWDTRTFSSVVEAYELEVRNRDQCMHYELNFEVVYWLSQNSAPITNEDYEKLTDMLLPLFFDLQEDLRLFIKNAGPLRPLK